MGTRRRNRRIARNQALFRAINDATFAWPKRRQASEIEELEFYCECAHRDCYDRMRLTRAEYEAVRSESARFAVLPGHVFPEAERVVAERDGYLIVEKNADVRGIVEETNPRKAVTA